MGVLNEKRCKKVAGNPGLQKSEGFPARSSESRVAGFLGPPALRAG